MIACLCMDLCHLSLVLKLVHHHAPLVIILLLQDRGLQLPQLVGALHLPGLQFLGVISTVRLSGLGTLCKEIIDLVHHHLWDDIVGEIGRCWWGLLLPVFMVPLLVI